MDNREQRVKLPTDQYLTLDLRDRRWLLQVGDVLMIVIGVVLSLIGWNFVSERTLTLQWVQRDFIWGGVMICLWGITAAGSGFNVRDYHLAHESTDYILRKFALFFVLYLILYYFLPTRTPPQMMVLFFIVIGSVLLFGWRKIWGWLLTRGFLKRNVLILGLQNDTKKVFHLLQEQATAGYRVMGLLAWDETELESTKENLKTSGDRNYICGTIGNLNRYVRRLNISDIVVSEQNDNRNEILIDNVLSSHHHGAAVVTAPELYERIEKRLPVSFLRENWLTNLPLWHRGTSTTFRLFKRIFDVMGAVVGLLLFVPIFPFLALGIKLSSPDGPIFYRQERVGKSGTRFELLKLRTMIPDAEKESGPKWSPRRDSRVTPFGRFLRRTHLDEFPQFWNVLKGDMSLVGPRPERPSIERDLKDLSPFYELRHAVKPGLTGWGFLRAGYVNTREQALKRLEYDLYYLKNLSFWFDVQILLETVWELIPFLERRRP